MCCSHPQSNVKHLSSTEGKASDSQRQLPLSVPFPFRLDGSCVSFCTLSKFCFSQPVALHGTFLCLLVSLTLFSNVLPTKKLFYLLLVCWLGHYSCHFSCSLTTFSACIHLGKIFHNLLSAEVNPI